MLHCIDYYYYYYYYYHLPLPKKKRKKNAPIQTLVYLRRTLYFYQLPDYDFYMEA